MGNGGRYDRLEEDIEMNRALCMHLMGRLGEAVRVLNTPAATTVREGKSGGGGSAPAPLWMHALFGTREGLSAAYIKLSQQHLKLVALQLELLQERRPDTPSPDDRNVPLSDEDLRCVRAFLDRLESSGEA